jgi:hypothetical protein
MRSILLAAVAAIGLSFTMAPAQAAWHGHHYNHSRHYHHGWNSYAYSPYRHHRHCWNQRQWRWGGWHWVRRCSW